MSSAQPLALIGATSAPQRCMTGRHARAAFAQCAVLPLALGACGGSDDSPAATPTATPTVTADWNLVAVKAWTQLEASAGAPIDLHYESRSLAMTNAAIHDVLNAIDRRYAPYAYDVPTPDASPDAAVAQAAHDVLVADSQLVSDFPAGLGRERAVAHLHRLPLPQVHRRRQGARREHRRLRRSSRAGAGSEIAAGGV